MRHLAANLGLAGEHFDGDGVLLPTFVQHFDRVSRRAVDGGIQGASAIDAGPLPMADACHQLPCANLGLHSDSIGFSDGVNQGSLVEG